MFFSCNRDTLHSFAQQVSEKPTTESHVLWSLCTGSTSHKPVLKLRPNFPLVHQWTWKEFHRALATCTNANKGTTDGHTTTSQRKRKPGHPPRKAETEEDPSMHFYLVNEGGSPVAEEEITKMSHKARMIWTFLDHEGLAPETFGQISIKAWEYYSHMMLAQESFDFLLLCDDGEWKLWEWSTRSYPSWCRCHKGNKLQVGDNQMQRQFIFFLDFQDTDIFLQS